MHSVAPCVHIPVLAEEVLAGLQVRHMGSYIDATLGLGGHAEAILRMSAPGGRLLGIDADPQAVEASKRRLLSYGERAMIVQANYREMGAIAMANGFSQTDGILLDLGVSSLQLSAAGRGFSFQYDAPLDMRMDPLLPHTAADLVNDLSATELSDILYRYGEEPFARRIARAIVRGRPIQTTLGLAQVVSAAVGRSGNRTHPATRTFQALRIAVNDELGSLRQALVASLELLRSGGRLAVISFHSLEDRIVKEFCREESRDCVCPPALPVCACNHRARLRLCGRAVTPSASEITSNPRSRSARLRVAERI